MLHDTKDVNITVRLDGGIYSQIITIKNTLHHRLCINPHGGSLCL